MFRFTAFFALCFFAARPLAAQQPTPAPQQTQAQTPPPPVSFGPISLQNVSLNEVIDLLARQLKLNIVQDPSVKGTVTLNTYGETRNMDARSLLDQILRISGFGMAQVGDLYRVVPLKDIQHQPIKMEVNAKNIPDDDQTMLNLIFLKYMTADELAKILLEFTGEYAVIKTYAPANLLFILDSHRNMRRTMDLIALFDSDTFANSRVRLFELKNARPSDVQKELETILRSISLDSKTTAVRFLPVDRINTLIAVAPNPGVFDTVEDWLRKLDVPVKVTAGAVDNYVYRVKYGRSDCLAQALSQLFGYGGAGGGAGYGGGFNGNNGLIGPVYAQPNAGYGGYPSLGGFAAGGYGGYGGGYGAGVYGGITSGLSGQNSFQNGYGGTGACGSGGFGGGGGGGYGGGYGGGGYGGFGYPTFGGYAAQAPAVVAGQPGAVGAASGVPGAAGAGAAPGTPGVQEFIPRIIPNPLDNSLLIQANGQQYQSILKLLKDLDIPPRQILLEAKIYSVDLSGDFESGVSAALQRKTGTDKGLLGTLSNGLSTIQAGALIGRSKELLGYLSLQENTSRAHIISEPSLIATDSIPASINVGTQVPTLQGQVASPVQVGGTNALVQSISSHNTGVTLNVNARVNPSGVVTLIIDQEVSKPVQPASSSSIQTPSFDQQVVQTQITMQDGDTIAIGGIISQSSTTTTNGITGLSKIPFLGFLFGSHSYTHDRSELIIFMTPHVIYDTTDLLEASDELKMRVKKMKKYIRDIN